jgi:hypothetical protein
MEGVEQVKEKMEEERCGELLSIFEKQQAIFNKSGEVALLSDCRYLVLNHYCCIWYYTRSSFSHTIWKIQCKYVFDGLVGPTKAFKQLALMIYLLIKISVESI